MKKILLADDSPISRNLMKSLLLNNYEIIEAENGRIALELAQKNNIDFFLLDLNMPELDGIKLTIELRKIQKYNKIPIIILSSELREDKKDEGKGAGATGWIAKDVDQSKLLEVIEKLI